MSDRNTGSEAALTAWTAGTTTAEDAQRAAEDTAKDTMQQAGREASRMAGDLRDQAAETAKSGKNQAAHRSADALKGREDWLAELVDRGADGLASFAGSLRGNDLRGTLSRIERMARDQPAMLVGASMAAGFALVRLGRAGVEQAGSSSGKRYGDGR